MEVRDHCLYEDDGTAVRFLSSPNQGGRLDPRCLVIHYTATRSLDAVVNWFRNPAARVSAHIVVDRDGRAVQLVRFDRQAWHAGRSRWQELEDLNACSVGLEFVNAGALQHAWLFGWVDCSGYRVPRRETLVARHKHESRERRWHLFTSRQIESGLAIAKALHERYGFRAVLGHDDIAPERKVDPGPAFPMTWLVAEVLGTTEAKEV
jgi:N-acetylmuramoyl-L-alanine amidase